MSDENIPKDAFLIKDMDTLVGALPGMLGHAPSESIIMVAWSRPDPDTLLSTTGAVCRIALEDADHGVIADAVRTLAAHGESMMLVIVTDHPQQMEPWIDFIESNPVMQVIDSRVVGNLVAPSGEVMEFLLEQGKALPSTSWESMAAPFKANSVPLDLAGDAERFPDALAALLDGGTEQDMADVAAAMATPEGRGTLAYTLNETNSYAIGEALRKVAVATDQADTYAACGLAYWAGVQANEAQVALFEALDRDPNNELASTVLTALRLGMEPTQWFDAREENNDG